METITDAVSIHSIKKSEYARRLAEGRLGHVSLFDHFKTVGIEIRCYLIDIDISIRHMVTHPPQNSLERSEILQNR